MPLCEQCHVQMRISKSFPGKLLPSASYLQTFAFLKKNCESSLAGTAPIPRLRLKFEVARQASSPSLCASVRAVPWADEDQQQRFRLDPFGCELSADVPILGAGLPEAPGTDPQSYL